MDLLSLEFSMGAKSSLRISVADAKTLYQMQPHANPCPNFQEMELFLDRALDHAEILHNVVIEDPHVPDPTDIHCTTATQLYGHVERYAHHLRRQLYVKHFTPFRG